MAFSIVFTESFPAAFSCCVCPVESVNPCLRIEPRTVCMMVANCDELVIIPFAGMKDGNTESAVESLNVAQAASILIYELTK